MARERCCRGVGGGVGGGVVTIIEVCGLGSIRIGSMVYGSYYGLFLEVGSKVKW